MDGKIETVSTPRICQILHEVPKQYTIMIKHLNPQPDFKR